jgi:hypothetical protein
MMMMIRFDLPLEGPWEAAWFHATSSAHCQPILLGFIHSCSSRGSGESGHFFLHGRSALIEEPLGGFWKSRTTVSIMLRYHYVAATH